MLQYPESAVEQKDEDLISWTNESNSATRIQDNTGATHAILCTDKQTLFPHPILEILYP
jgi:hypothetical protein